MTFLPKCNCGESISGVCNGKGLYCGSKSTVVWSDFINKHNITEEEEQELAIMLEFIRLRKNIPELKAISLRLKQLLIK